MLQTHLESKGGSTVTMKPSIKTPSVEALREEVFMFDWLWFHFDVDLEKSKVPQRHEYTILCLLICVMLKDQTWTLDVFTQLLQEC